MFSFNRKYLFLALLLFSVEVLIAVFIQDSLIRPFAGDVLVVVLIYCFLRIFFNGDYRKTAFIVFLFAFTIEILQYFDCVKLLGLENNRLLSVILGRTFEYTDFAAYFTGFLIVLLCEKIFHNPKL